MAEPTAVAALRFLHVLAATMWMGGGTFFLFVLRPMLRQDADGAVVRRLAVGAFPKYMAATSGATLLLGLVLYWLVDAHETYATETLGGLLFQVGVAAGLVAFLLGATIQAPLARRLRDAATSGKDTAPIVRRIVRDGTLGLVLLTVSLLGMTAAQNLLHVDL